MSAPVLVLAALPEEGLPVSRRLREGPSVVGITGDGSVQAARGAQRLLAEMEPAAVLVVGAAGALTPDVERGEVVLVRQVMLSPGSRFRWIPSPTLMEMGRRRGLREGTVLTTRNLVSTPDERRALGAAMRQGGAPEGPVLVDLETAEFAAAAEAAGVPWAALRVVSDQADGALPPAVCACQGEDGSVARWDVLARAVRRPWELPELVRLAVRMRRCCKALSEVALPLVADIEALERVEVEGAAPTSADPPGAGADPPPAEAPHPPGRPRSRRDAEAAMRAPQQAPDLLTGDRKAEHLRLAMRRDMQLERRYFDGWRLEHRALPELSMDEVDTSMAFLGRPLRAPLLISGMTGGTPAAAEINRNLAVAAERCGVALGVGSQRAAIEDPLQAWTFEVREWAPSVPVFANLGAVQLNYGFGLEECRTAVRMVDADALVFHVNVLQEAIQPEGQTDFRGLLDRMGDVAAGLDVPVIVKEVGCGVSGAMGRELLERGIRIVDAAGLGGTSWARIEAARAGDAELGERFAGWGIPTPEAIRQLAAVEGLTVIGSGGLRSGVDMAKAMALGAHLTGMAKPFLEAATVSADEVAHTIELRVRELRIAMLCTGARTLADLRRVRVTREGER